MAPAVSPAASAPVGVAALAAAVAPAAPPAAAAVASDDSASYASVSNDNIYNIGTLKLSHNHGLSS
jgi:hypothetical protein